MPLTTIFFDVGEVLIGRVESLHPKLASYLNIPLEIYKNAVFKIDQIPEIRNTWPKTLEEEKAFFNLFQKNLLEELNIKPSEEKINYMVNELMFPQRWLNPNALTVLEYLSSKYDLAVITNSLISRTLDFEKLGLNKFFKQIFISRIIGFKKPDPRIFEYALKTMDKKPEESAFVDNELENVLTAQKIDFQKAIFYSKENPNIPGIIACQNLLEIKELLN